MQMLHHREKWSLFDESTRVPLLIHHPLSPFKGMHYPEPVELIDIYPTLNDILGAPFNKQEVCKFSSPTGIHKCVPLQGKSLAPVILGDIQSYSTELVGSGKRLGKGKTGKSGKGRPKARGKGRGKGKGKGRGRDSFGEPQSHSSLNVHVATGATGSTDRRL